MAAVQQDWSALKYVKDQTEEICMEAITKNPDAFHYVKYKTGKLCKLAYGTEESINALLMKIDRCIAELETME